MMNRPTDRTRQNAVAGRTLFIALGICFGALGCGQKGPLFHPQPPGALVNAEKNNTQMEAVNQHGNRSNKLL